MANPRIQNLKPGEGGTFTPTGPLYLSVRDEDTRVDRYSVQALATFAKTRYAATALPGSVGTYLDVFNDALPESRPPNNTDRFLTEEVPYDSDFDGSDDSVYGPVLTLEKAISGEDTERGVLFVEADKPSLEITPVGCEIVVGLPSYTTEPGSYFADADYTGVVAGFVSWPDNSGVFAFFKDDMAGTRSIVVAGPAQDGSGTRLVSAETVVDWAQDIDGNSIEHAPPAIRVVWDMTRLGTVYVFLTNNSSQTMSVDGGAETLEPNEEIVLLESPIADLGTFQAAARVGNYFSENPPNKVAAFAGINHGSVSDYVEVHSIKVEEFGLFLVGSGSSVRTAEVTRRTSDMLAVADYSDTAHWDRSEIVSVAQESTYFTVSKESNTDNSALYFQESDLLSQKFLMVLQGSVRQSSHEGSQSTGVGVDIDDGTSLIALRFLDNFETQRIGVFSDSSASQKTSTTGFTVADSTWPLTTPEILLVGDVDQGFLELFISEDPDVPVSSLTATSFSSPDPIPYSSVPSSYAVPTVGLGFLDGSDGVNYGGSFTVSKFLLIPGIDLFLPSKARKYADDFGVVALPSEPSGVWDAWTVFSAGSGNAEQVVSVENPTWKIVCPSEQDRLFLFKTFSEQMFLPGQSGITLLAQVKVTEWFDQFGSQNTKRIPTCAIMAIDLGDELFLQLQSVLSTGGEQYIFVSQDSQDYIEVLNQTELGQKISHQIDITEMHTYMVSYRPGEGVKVFIDFSDTPAIDLSWEERSAVEKGSDYLSSGIHSVAVGAIPVSTLGESASMTMGMIGVSVGSGLDFVSTMLVDDSTLENSIYGASANVFVDVVDED